MSPREQSLPNRDTVTTIQSDGSRRFVFPADVRGRFSRWRRLAAVAMIALYVLLPWIQIGGYPAVFLDVSLRRFHLFGATLAAEDLWLMFFLISGLGFGLYVVTALFGRIWCGWACPQTVFLDHVYRRIERLLEGDAVSRRRKAAEGWSPGRILRLGVKHVCYLAVSAAITHIFLAYFVSIPALWGMMKEAPSAHWEAFAGLAAATLAVQFNFAWFREQLCIVICPYGRLQSALIDDNSMVVGYDARRGEPRGKVGSVNAGACIDCQRCVQVCPTGIDIRQGLQIECIGCTACIDACDEIMTRVNRPRGLIRYDSLSGFSGRRTHWLRPRLLIYGALLAAGASVATWAIAGVKPAVLSVTRMVGAPYFRDEHAIRNQFLVRVVNKADHEMTYTLGVSGGPSGLRVNGDMSSWTVPALAEVTRPLVVQVPNGDYDGSFRLHVRLDDEKGTLHLEGAAEFLGPDKALMNMLKPAR